MAMPGSDGVPLAEVIDALEARYDPRTAEEWDAVGLTCGDPRAPVRRVHFAVDPVRETVDEAVAAGADLLVTHHPLLLRGVHGVPADDPKGTLVHDLIRAGVALFTAHTNADVARPGVSDALAAALGVHDTTPLAPRPKPALDKIIAFVPEAAADRVLDAMAAAGAGRIGDYSRAAFATTGTGTFRPEAGSTPHLGTVGAIERVAEVRLETVLPRRLRSAVVAAMRGAHPYEEPAYDVLELADVPADIGLGRIGRLASTMTLDAFVQRVSGALPATAWGVRAAGDPGRQVQVVAVSGGAGESLLGVVTGTDADVCVTADLRHHPAAEHRLAGGPALVDVAHWATEWPWLASAADLLRADLRDRIGTTVSTLLTDPWTIGAAADCSNRSAAALRLSDDPEETE
ncbi:MAG: Nif3-like dinuclear metal center hexameric protein [Mycobacteriales bacterium]